MPVFRKHVPLSIVKRCSEQSFLRFIMVVGILQEKMKPFFHFQYFVTEFPGVEGSFPLCFEPSGSAQ